MLPDAAKVLWFGLRQLADRDGRLEECPLTIRAYAMPFQPDADIEAMLADLAAAGLVTRYQANGMQLLELAGFKDTRSPFFQSTYEDEKSLGLPAPPGAGRDRAPTPLSSTPLNFTPPPATGPGARGDLFDNGEPVAESPGPSISTPEANDADRSPGSTPPSPSTQSANAGTPASPSVGGVAGHFDPLFLKVHANHPKPDRIHRAYEVWLQLSPRPDEAKVSLMLAAQNRCKATKLWQAEGGRYATNLADWLRERRWEDHLPVLADERKRTRAVSAEDKKHAAESARRMIEMGKKCAMCREHAAQEPLDVGHNVWPVCSECAANFRGEPPGEERRKSG